MGRVLSTHGIILNSLLSPSCTSQRLVLQYSLLTEQWTFVVMINPCPMIAGGHSGWVAENSASGKARDLGYVLI